MSIQKGGKKPKEINFDQFIEKSENLLRQFSSSNLIEFSDKLSLLMRFNIVSPFISPCQDMKSLGLI